MEFRNTSEVNKFISKLILLDETGSQGATYVDKEFKRVYKFFYSFLDPGFLEGICNDPSKEELLHKWAVMCHLDKDTMLKMQP